MEFHKALIELATYAMHIATFYMIIDIIVNRYYLWVFFNTRASIDVAVAKTVMDISLQMADKEAGDLASRWESAGVLNHADERWRNQVFLLGSRVSKTSARFALFKALYLDDYNATFPHQEKLTGVMDQLRDFYMEVGRLSAEDAEQKIIDDSLFAIADLDFNGEILANSSLQNPAESHYRKSGIPGKEKTL